MTRRRKPQPPPEKPDGFDQWDQAEYEVARPRVSEDSFDVDVVAGWTYRGLGLLRFSGMEAKYVRKDGSRRLWESWSITHLNTGHFVAHLLSISAERALRLATDLADAADWDFDGLNGWQNVEPDLPKIYKAWQQRYGLVRTAVGYGHDDAAARAIGSKRW